MELMQSVKINWRVRSVLAQHWSLYKLQMEALGFDAWMEKMSIKVPRASV